MADALETAIPAQPAPLQHRMGALSGRLTGVGAIKIVAIGSSTTAGEGGVVPYPQRLENALRKLYPGRNFDVLNRGVIGEEAPDELVRMPRDVIDERPSVVIWQVGTNAAWKGTPVATKVAKALSDGLATLSQLGADVILMDLQYVPALLTTLSMKQAGEQMVDLIASAAERAAYPVNVFRRYDMMRRWHHVERISFDRIVNPWDDKRLHHSDWSADRMAKALADTMVTAAALTV